MNKTSSECRIEKPAEKGQAVCMAGFQKISVLLPCYAQAHFVREAVESILNQDFADWELVASDDASPDDTATILQELARQDKRVRLFRQTQRLGMGENWNFCLQEAKGTAIKLMGADDRLERPDCLSRQWQSLQNPEVALVACARNIIDENSRVVTTLASLPCGTHSAKSIIPLMLEHQDNLIGEPVCCLFRRADAVRGFEYQRQQSADVEMWFHLLSRGSLAYDIDPLVAFRVHARQKSELNLPVDRGYEHLQLIAGLASAPGIPPNTRLAVLFRSEEWLRKQPSHPGAREIAARITELKSHFFPLIFANARILHGLRRAVTRWKHSVRKRLPLSWTFRK